MAHRYLVSCVLVCGATLHFGVGNSGHILCLLEPAAVLHINTEVGTLIHLIFAVSFKVWHKMGGW